MAWLVKVPAAKPGDLSLIPETYMVEGGKKTTLRLSSDFPNPPTHCDMHKPLIPHGQ